MAGVETEKKEDKKMIKDEDENVNEMKDEDENDTTCTVAYKCEECGHMYCWGYLCDDCEAGREHTTHRFNLYCCACGQQQLYEPYTLVPQGAMHAFREEGRRAGNSDAEDFKEMLRGEGHRAGAVIPTVGAHSERFYRGRTCIEVRVDRKGEYRAYGRITPPRRR